MGKGLEWTVTQRWYIKHQVCSTPVIREMQIKTIVWYHLILIKIVTIKKTKITGVGEDLEQSEPLYTVGGDVKCYSFYGKNYDSSSIKYEISLWSSNKRIENRVWKIYIHNHGHRRIIQNSPKVEET